MAHRHLTPASGSGAGQAKVCYSPGDRGTRKGGKERSSFSGGPSRSDGKGSFAPNPLPETKLIRLFPPYTDNHSSGLPQCRDSGFPWPWKTVFRLLPTGITAWKNARNPLPQNTDNQRNHLKTKPMVCRAPPFVSQRFFGPPCLEALPLPIFAIKRVIFHYTDNFAHLCRRKQLIQKTMAKAPIHTMPQLSVIQ